MQHNYLIENVNWFSLIITIYFVVKRFHIITKAQGSIYIQVKRTYDYMFAYGGPFFARRIRMLLTYNVI